MAPVLWSFLALCVVGRISALPLDAWFARQHGDIARFLQQYRSLNTPDADNDLDGALVDVVGFESQSKVDDSGPHTDKYQLVTKAENSTDSARDAEETTDVKTTADVALDGDSTTEEDLTTVDGSELLVRVTDDFATTDAVTVRNLAQADDLLTTDQDALPVTESVPLKILAEIHDDSVTTIDPFTVRNLAQDDDLPTTTDSFLVKNLALDDSLMTTDSVPDFTDVFLLKDIPEDTTDTTDSLKALGQDSNFEDVTATTALLDRDLAVDDDSLTTMDSVTFRILSEGETTTINAEVSKVLEEDSLASILAQFQLPASDDLVEDDALTTDGSVTEALIGVKAVAEETTTDSVPDPTETIVISKDSPPSSSNSSESATQAPDSVTDSDLDSITIEIAGSAEETSDSSVSKVQATGEQLCAGSTSIDSKCHGSTQQIDSTNPSAATQTIQTDGVMTDEPTSRDPPDTKSANDSTTPDATQ